LGFDWIRKHKSKILSRKRQRPDHWSFGTMSDTTFEATAEADAVAASKSPATPRCGTSWRLLLPAVFLALQVVASSASGTMDTGNNKSEISAKAHTKHSIDHSSEAIWRAIDQENASSLRKPLLLLKQQSGEKAPSSLQKESSHRSLRARPRERFRKEHTISDYHYPATKEERHRLLITCDETQRQDDCLSQLLKTYGEEQQHRIEVVHNLEIVHSLSVDVDSNTLERLVTDGKFAFEMDFARGPLVIEGSMSYYEPPINEDGSRYLQDSQAIPWGVDAIRAQEVWQKYGVQGEGVKICVLDSGVMASHEDFRQSKFDGYYGNEFVSPYWYEDNKGHGTHIAGTIAASDNTIGIVGIAPKAETYIVRVFDDDRNFYGFSDGTAYSTDLIAAATICKEWGADVINASLGGTSYNRVEEDFFKSLYHDHGILTVAASGNGGDDQNVYPAAYEGVLSVGAVDESLDMAAFSTFDPSTTDVLAPGVDILSTFKDNIYATFSGTSMAAPHATGALALMLSYINAARINIGRQDIFKVLKHTLMLTNTTRSTNSGDNNVENDDSREMGVIDVFASIEYLESYENETKGRSPLFPEKDPSVNKCENEVRFDITTDSKGAETFYRLMRLSDEGNEVIWMQGPDALEDNSKYSERACFEGPEGCYQFDIRDRGSDGISEGGGIEIVYNGHTLYKGGNFGRGGMLRMGDCGN